MIFFVHNVSLVFACNRNETIAGFVTYWSFHLHHSYSARLGWYRMSSFWRPIDTYVHLGPSNSSPCEHHTTAASVYIIFTDEADVELLAYQAGSLCGRPNLNREGLSQILSSDLSCSIAQMPVATR